MKFVCFSLFFALFAAPAIAKPCPLDSPSLIGDILALSAERALVLTSSGRGSQVFRMNTVNCSQRAFSDPADYNGMVRVAEDGVLLIPDAPINAVAKTFNTSTGSFAKAFDFLPSNSSNNCVFLSENRLALIYAFGGDVQIWNFLAGRLLNRFNVGDLDFPALGQVGDSLVQISSDRKPFFLQLWDVQTGSLLKNFSLPSHASDQEYVPGDVLTIDDTRFVVSYTDGYVEIWDIKAQKIVNSFFAHQDFIRSLVLIDTERFATGGQDQIVKVWHWPSAKMIQQYNVSGHEDYIAALATQGLDQLLVGFAEGDVQILILPQKK